jgi:hypothetical protein
MTRMWLDDTDAESTEYDIAEADRGFGGSIVDWVDCEAEWQDCCAECESARDECGTGADCESQWKDCCAECESARQECEVAWDRRRRTRRRVRRRRPADTSPPRATAAAVRTLDLETKVQQDTLRSALAAQTKRMSLSEYSAVAGAAVNQFIETFDAPTNPYARAALRFSPFLLMSPQSRGSGVEGIVKDPRVLGAALVAGIVVVGENSNQRRRPRDITIVGPTHLFVGDSVTLIADVIDGRGAILPAERVTWQSSDPKVAQIDSASGALRAGRPGTAVITATSGDLARRFLLTVTHLP